MRNSFISSPPVSSFAHYFSAFSFFFFFSHRPNLKHSHFLSLAVVLSFFFKASFYFFYFCCSWEKRSFFFFFTVSNRLQYNLYKQLLLSPNFWPGLHFSSLSTPIYISTQCSLSHSSYFLFNPLPSTHHPFLSLKLFNLSTTLRYYPNTLIPLLASPKNINSSLTFILDDPPGDWLSLSLSPSSLSFTHTHTHH